MNDPTYDIQQLDRGTNVQEEQNFASQKIAENQVIHTMPFMFLTALITWLIKINLEPTVRVSVQTLPPEDDEE